MKIKTATVILMFAGLVLNACKSDHAGSKQAEASETNLAEKPAEVKGLADKVKQYVTEVYLTEGDLRAISEDQRKFQIYPIDLNGDGKEEVLVNFPSSYFCGTGGCTLLLLDGDLEPITEFTVTRTPIFAEIAVENGWRVLLVQSEGKWRKLVYENGSYPSNPSLVEATSEVPGESAEIVFDEKDSQPETYSF